MARSELNARLIAQLGARYPAIAIKGADLAVKAIPSHPIVANVIFGGGSVRTPVNCRYSEEPFSR